jgi:hypothetical protein
MDHKTHTPDSPPAGIDPAAAPRNSLAEARAPAPCGLPEPEFGFSPPDHYDPDEYRWVPVRRQPRRDGWTEEKQRRFIEVLADTGLVGTAAREVGMRRTAAYKLRRAPHAAAFARAWDVARERAGALIEDVAFERALEGVETEIYDRDGGLTGSKTIYNDRLLTFLLQHLKPERYGSATQMRLRAAAAHEAHEAAEAEAAGSSVQADTPTLTLDEALRAMEPALPAPAEELFDPEDLDEALLTAEIADGTLPRFHAEQGPVKSDARLRAEEITAMYERGRLIDERMDAADEAGETPPDLTDEETAAWYLYIDPTQAKDVPRKTRRKR